MNVIKNNSNNTLKNIVNYNYEEQLATANYNRMTPREFMELLYLDQSGKVDEKNSLNISYAIFKNISSRICQARQNKVESTSCIKDIECDALLFACRTILALERNSLKDAIKDNDELAAPLQNYMTCLNSYEAIFRQTIPTGPVNKETLCLLIDRLENYLNWLKYSILCAVSTTASTLPIQTNQRFIYADESGSSES